MEPPPGSLESHPAPNGATHGPSKAAATAAAPPAGADAAPPPPPSDTPPPPLQQQQEAPQQPQQPWSQRLRAWLTGHDDLRLAPPWAVWPDYDRVENVNAIVRGLWPHVSAGIEGAVRELVPTLLADAVREKGGGFLVGLELERFDLGPVPPRLTAVKAFDASSDEQVLFEAAFAWGSDTTTTLAATLRLPPLPPPLRAAAAALPPLCIPVTVRRLQLSGHVRVAARPLLEGFPFAGSVSVSLMAPPHIDFELPLSVPPWLAPPGVAAWSSSSSSSSESGTPFIDLMALPLVRGAFRAAVRLAAQRLLVYPRCYQVELVPGGAKPPGPVGMLTVRLVRAAGLRSEDLVGQSDPYAVIQVRDGRTQRSSTKRNTNHPEWDETFVLLASFIHAPRTTVPLAITLRKPSRPPAGPSSISSGSPLLALPLRLLGLPAAAAAAGGRAVAGGLGASFGAVGHGHGGGSGSGGLGTAAAVAAAAGGANVTGQQQGEGLTGEAAAAAAAAADVAGSSSSEIGSSYGSSEQSESEEEGGEGEQQQGTDQQQQQQQQGWWAEGAGWLPPPLFGMAPAALDTATGFSVPAVSSDQQQQQFRPQQQQQQPRRPLSPQLAPLSLSPPPGCGGGRSGGGGGGGGGAVSAPVSPLARSLGSPRGAPLTTISAPPPIPPLPPSGALPSAAAVHGGVGGSGLQQQAAVAGQQRSGRGSSGGGSSQQEGMREGGGAEGSAEAATRSSSSGGGAAESSGGGGKRKKRVAPKEEDRGTVFLDVTYTPFNRSTAAATAIAPSGTPAAGGAPAALGAAAAACAGAAAPPAAAAAAAAGGTVGGGGGEGMMAAAGQGTEKEGGVGPRDKGILTVTLVRATNLGGWTSEPDPFVELQIFGAPGAAPLPGGGAARGRVGGERNWRQVSGTVWNEANPRFNEKFDFVGVPAGAVLLATVRDRETAFERITTLRVTSRPEDAPVLGRARVSLSDVAAAGRLRGSWPLQGALQGDLEMALEWIDLGAAAVEGLTDV